MDDLHGKLPAPTTSRVLVVDDDAAVGLAIREALKPLQVTFAQSAAGALARVAAGGKYRAGPRGSYRVRHRWSLAGRGCSAPAHAQRLRPEAVHARGAA